MKNIISSCPSFQLKLSIYTLIFCTTIGLLSACTNRNEADLLVPTNPNNCTPTPTFTKVLSIMESNCKACHGANGISIPLTNYQEINGAKESILNRITLPTSDIRFMPQNGNPIPTCDIESIRQWINEGAPNN